MLAQGATLEVVASASASSKPPIGLAIEGTLKDDVVTMYIRLIFKNQSCLYSAIDDI